jgi:hypothetical protein
MNGIDHIKIKVDPDGQVWIHFDAGGGRQGLLNLNNIVLEMNQAGINRGICLDALSKATGDQA